MRSTEAMIAFNIGGPIKVGPWPDRTKWSKGLRFTIGACFAETHEAGPWKAVAKLFVDFQAVVTLYGVPVADAHREFMKIDEYRWHILPDCEGAEDMPDDRIAFLCGETNSPDGVA